MPAWTIWPTRTERSPDDAVDRRPHDRVGEVQLRLIELGLRGRRCRRPWRSAARGLVGLDLLLRRRRVRRGPCRGSPRCWRRSASVCWARWEVPAPEVSRVGVALGVLGRRRRGRPRRWRCRPGCRGHGRRPAARRRPCSRRAAPGPWRVRPWRPRRRMRASRSSMVATRSPAWTGLVVADRDSCDEARNPGRDRHFVGLKEGVVGRFLETAYCPPVPAVVAAARAAGEKQSREEQLLLAGLARQLRARKSEEGGVAFGCRATAGCAAAAS